MSSLFKLFFVQRKAKLRALLSKPSSTIFTILGLLWFSLILTPFLLFEAKSSLNVQNYTNYTLISLTFTLFFCIFVFVQKKQALFFEEDAYFLFTGPFSNQQILAYSVFYNIIMSIISSLLCTVFSLVLISLTVKIPLIYLLFSGLVTTLIIFIVTSFSQYVYLYELIHEKSKKLRYLLVGILCLLLIVGSSYLYLKHQNNFLNVSIDFLKKDTVHYIPLFGWGKYALMGLFQQDFWATFLGTGALCFVALLIAVLNIRIKGYFFEQALTDAIAYSDSYNDTAKEKKEALASKIFQIGSYSFRPKEQAIFSKNLLILLKSKQFFTQLELYIIAFAIILGQNVLPNYLAYSCFVLFAIVNTVNRSALIDDLKNNYIYLIPGNPFRKMLSTLAIPFLKTLILSSILMVIGFVIYQAAILDLLVFLGVVGSFVIVFYAGELLALRYFKSNNNEFFNSLIRILMMLLSAIPSVLLLAGLYFIGGKLKTLLYFGSLIVILVNLLIGTFVIYACSPMLNGNSYASD
jgi:hypothetical protein